MNDRYIRDNQVLNRLIDDYREHGKLIIAFDFDNTVSDYWGKGDEYPFVEFLLRKSKEQGHTLILFTCKSGYAATLAANECSKKGYGPDLINTSPVLNTVKPYYNILLDDRAGLRSASNVLHKFLENQGAYENK
jgi:hypothetical protein